MCGGHVATLHAEDLLREEPGIDFVVRLAGEAALVQLLGEPDEDALATIPGLVRRDARGDVVVGAPAMAVAVDRLPATPRALSEQLGVPSADLVVSRGCEAHCGYCCVAEASDLARAESKRAGIDGARHARRPVDAIADEMASLHHAHGVRAFSFMDDNVLPLEPSHAARFANELGAALRGRGVPPIAFTLQLRADAVSDESADALAALGLGRAYVGVDAYTDEGLRVLGRASSAAAGGRALSLLRARRIPAIANALVLGPTTKLETLEGEAGAIRSVAHGPIHLLPIEARSGTAIARRAEKLGLVEGGFLHRTYRFADPRTALVGRVLFELPTRLRQRSVPVAMYDLGESLGVASRLFPSLDLAWAWALWDETSALWNAEQAETILRASEAARGGLHATEALLRAEKPRVAALDRALLQSIDAASRRLERDATRSAGRPALARARSVTMAAVASAMSLAGCASAPDETDAGTDAPTVDASLDAPTVDASLDAPLDAPHDGGTCADPDRRPNWEVAANGSHACDACDPGYVVEAQVDVDGRVTSFELRAEDGGASSLPAEVQACLESLFAGYCYPSAAGGTVVFSPHCWIA